jgi:hypothetical protein
MVMGKLEIELPPKFAAGCLIGLLYHIHPSYNLTYRGDRVIIEGPNPHKALQDVLLTARQMIEDKNNNAGSVMIRLPASGNDKKVMDALKKSYGLGADATMIDFVKVVQANLDVKDQYPLPSILKPEFYEFNRLPGYLGESTRKMRDQYPVLSVSLSLIGYLVCKVGSAQMDRGDWVSVIVTPEIMSSTQVYEIDPKYRLSTFVEPVRGLNSYLSQRKYSVAGLFPEAALLLWLTSHMGGAKINLYAINEPGGQTPATIYSSMKIDLEPIHRSLTNYDLLNQNIRPYMVKILENALRAVERSAAKSLSVRLSILLYEVLSGRKPVEEFVYAASREYAPWSHTPPDRNHPLYMSYLVSRWAAYVARHLTRMVVGGPVRV